MGIVGIGGGRIPGAWGSQGRFPGGGSMSKGKDIKDTNFAFT